MDALSDIVCGEQNSSCGLAADHIHSASSVSVLGCAIHPSGTCVSLYLMQMCNLLLLLDLCHIMIKRLTLPRMDYEIWTQNFHFARVQLSEHADDNARPCSHADPCPCRRQRTPRDENSHVSHMLRRRCRRNCCGARNLEPAIGMQ